MHTYFYVKISTGSSLTNWLKKERKGFPLFLTLQHGFSTFVQHTKNIMEKSSYWLFVCYIFLFLNRRQINNPKNVYYNRPDYSRYEIFYVHLRAHDGGLVQTRSTPL